jgi:pyruvate-ferredoxin/flavodoxin oxidoreductase
MSERPRYPGLRVTANGNQLVSYHTETRIADAGVFYPITPSTEGGELYQQAFAEGKLNVFGHNTIAVEAEGEHAAQGGAIAHSVCGKRVVNYTSGQGVVYGVEQYYHAPGKCSTMVLEVAARALTKHALNVHCGHDDVYGALDTGWIIVFGKDAQQAADQALILRRVTELSLTPGMNVMDGFLTSHLERTFYKHESALIREYLGAPDDVIDCPTESQRRLFGPTRRRVPQMIDLRNPVLLGPVQNQEHYMQGVVARRNHFTEPILEFLDAAYRDFGELTGRHYGLVSQYKTDDADTVFVSLGSAAEKGWTICAPGGARRSARSISTCSGRSRKRRSCRRWLASATSSSSSAPTSQWPATTPWDATYAPPFTRRCSTRTACRPSPPIRCRASSEASTASGRATSGRSIRLAPTSSQSASGHGRTANALLTASPSWCSASTIPTR